MSRLYVVEAATAEPAPLPTTVRGPRARQLTPLLAAVAVAVLNQLAADRRARSSGPGSSRSPQSAPAGDFAS